MADSVWVPASGLAVPAATQRHSALVRITHWMSALCFFALLLSGVEILISHPRFYWGETGNVRTPALFRLPIPTSRSTIPNGYNYSLPDQNGWSRYLHFQAAWVVVLTGLLYVIAGLFGNHFRRGFSTYNMAQRLTYLFVIFVLFPLVIWTGLAMSPAMASAFPAAVTVLGGQQSARTIHFFVSVFLFFFVLIHVVMVYRAGFRRHIRAMIVGE